MKRKRRIYPKHKHLLGKMVIDQGFRCFVAGIDSRKGITINHFDEEEGKKTFGHATCLHSPKRNYDNFHKIFCELVKQIEEGIIKFVPISTAFGDEDTCAFR